MIGVARIAWNLAVGVWLVVAALRFDYCQYRRLGRRWFRFTGEKWAFSRDEQKWLHRFLLGLAVGLLGNALLAGIELFAVVSHTP